MNEARLRMIVNGEGKPVDVPARTSLADFLRDILNLTGTKIGCEQGVCGSCTVLVDGLPVRSCLTLAVSCQGSEVVTIEGLADPDIDVLRREFSKNGALQCGFCTAGMLMTAHELVRRRSDLSLKGVASAMSGNICRCTGYNGIIRAIEAANIDGIAREAETTRADEYETRQYPSLNEQET